MFVIAGTFDVQTTSSYSVSSEGMVCVECELVPGTQARGCRVELDCDNGNHVEQDFFTSSLPTASGCLPSASSASTFCTLLFYDIEEDGNVSSNPALSLDDVLISGITMDMTMTMTSTPSETGYREFKHVLYYTTEYLLMQIHS